MKRTRQQTTTVILRIKAQVRQRDGHCCVGCGLSNADHIARHGKQLQVHRKVPGSLYGLDGCETVCHACHGRRPKRPKGAPDLAYGAQTPPLGLRFDEALVEVFRTLARKHRRTLTAEISIAMEDYAAKFGSWPPPEPAPPTPPPEPPP